VVTVVKVAVQTVEQAVPEQPLELVALEALAPQAVMQTVAVVAEEVVLDRQEAPGVLVLRMLRLVLPLLVALEQQADPQLQVTAL
jgi:hypothetical protein